MFQIWGFIDAMWCILDFADDEYDAYLCASNHSRNFDNEEWVKIITPDGKLL